MIDKRAKKVETHYQLCLQLKNEFLLFLNNRQAAEKRLDCLKRRFLQDPKTFDNFKELIQDLLEKG